MTNRYGRWKVIGTAAPSIYTRGGKRSGQIRRERMVVCECNCGAIRVVKLQNLTRGLSTSCGCFKAENTARLKTKHGHKPKSGGSPLWRTWINVHSRCYNENVPCYSRYGGRGIEVCDRWHRDNPDGFKNFVADMGDKPSPNHSIDRINNALSYMPSNCRWATTIEQRHNRRDAA